jgi:hypothetical protein
VSDAAERIGNGEREAAIAALKTHQGEGRLDSREYEDRALRARQSRTWADLDPLFADLPEPRPHPGAAGRLPSSSIPPATSQPVSGYSGLLPEPWAAWAMSLTPFAALILFFVTGSWLWFLAIPIAGIVIYGPDGKDGHHIGDQRYRRGRRGRRGC